MRSSPSSIKKWTYTLVVGGEGGPVRSGPLPLILEPGGGLGVSADVEGVASRTPVEGSIVLADASDRSPRLPETDARDGRGDLVAVLRHDVDDAVAQICDVAGTEVVPPSAR